MLEKRRLAGIALILVALVSLAVIAPGYADKTGESGRLEANGSSGSIQVGIRIGDVLDRGADPQHFPGDNKEDKDVAVTEAACADAPVFSAGSNDYYRSVSVMIEGAYPYYETGWTLELANGGVLPVRIDGIETVWSGRTELRDFLRPDQITLHRGGLTQSVATWEDLEDALRENMIAPGETLAIDFSFYFEEHDLHGELMPENAWCRLEHLVSFSQSVPGGGDGGGGDYGEPITRGEEVQPYAPPAEGPVAQEPLISTPPPAGPGAGQRNLPYTGGRIALFLCSGVALMTLGVLLRREK